MLAENDQRCRASPIERLLLHRGEVFGYPRASLTELDLLASPDSEHPADHAAVELDIGVQRAAKALHEAQRPQPAARAAAAYTQLRFDDPARQPD